MRTHWRRSIRTGTMNACTWKRDASTWPKPIISHSPSTWRRSSRQSWWPTSSCDHWRMVSANMIRPSIHRPAPNGPPQLAGECWSSRLTKNYRSVWFAAKRCSPPCVSRFGHSQINNIFFVKNANGEVFTYNMRDVFFEMSLIYLGQAEGIIKGLCEMFLSCSAQFAAEQFSNFPSSPPPGLITEPTMHVDPFFVNDVKVTLLCSSKLWILKQWMILELCANFNLSSLAKGLHVPITEPYHRSGSAGAKRTSRPWSWHSS